MRDIPKNGCEGDKTKAGRFLKLGDVLVDEMVLTAFALSKFVPETYFANLLISCCLNSVSVRADSCVKQIALSILSRLISRELFCTAFSPFRTTVVFSFAYIIISYRWQE